MYALLCIVLFSVAWIGAGMYGLYTVRNLDSCTMTYSRPSYIPVNLTKMNMVPALDMHRCGGEYACLEKLAGDSSEGKGEENTEDKLETVGYFNSLWTNRDEAKFDRLSSKYGLFRVHSGVVESMLGSKKAKGYCHVLLSRLVPYSPLAIAC